MNDLMNFSFFDLLPPSLQEDSDIKILSQVIDEEFQKINELMRFTNPLFYIDEMPDLVLDYLAWEFHVDYWESDLPLATKRELIKQSIPTHRIKGTPAAVEGILSTVLGDAKVKEWFEYSGNPYFFRVETTDRLEDGKSFERILRLVESTQNVRSILERVVIRHEQKISPSVGMIVHSLRRTEIGLRKPQGGTISQRISVGMVCHVARRYEIGLRKPQGEEIAIRSGSGVAVYRARKITIQNKEV